MLKLTKKQERELLELMGFFKDETNSEAYLNDKLDVNLSQEAIRAYLLYKKSLPEDNDD